MPATLPHHLRSDCLHRRAPWHVACKPPPSAEVVHETAPARPTQQHPCTADIHKRPLTAQLPPMQAAYHGGPAMSAAPSFRDSVPATLPHHPQSHCLQATQPLGPTLATPTTRYSPARNCLSPHHAAASVHCRRSQAPAHSAADAADARSVPWRSSDVSCVISARLGASDAAPSSWIIFPARRRHPSARPSRARPPGTAPRASRPSRQQCPCKPAIASSRSRSCLRGMRRTAEPQRRQQLHRCETRCQRRCPSCSDLIACTPRRPSARP